MQCLIRGMSLGKKGMQFRFHQKGKLTQCTVLPPLHSHFILLDQILLWHFHFGYLGVFGYLFLLIVVDLSPMSDIHIQATTTYDSNTRLFFFFLDGRMYLVYFGVVKLDY